MGNNDYRDEMRELRRETTWTMGQWLPVGLIVLAILVIVGWGLQATGIIGKNIEREVVQHSRQYTESKQATLQNLYTEYISLQTKVAEAEAANQPKIIEALNAQQWAIIAQMRREATNIPSSEVPDGVKKLIN